MKELKLKNVFGKPVKVTSGAVKVNGLPSKGKEGLQYYDTISKEYYSYDNGRWTSLTQETHNGIDSRRIQNMGYYGKYYFLGENYWRDYVDEAPDWANMENINMAGSIKPGLVIAPDFDFDYFELGGRDGFDNPHNAFYSCKEIYSDIVITKLNKYLDAFLDEHGSEYDTLTDAMTDAFNAYVLPKYNKECVKASCLDPGYMDSMTYNGVRHRCYSTCVIYDVEYIIDINTIGLVIDDDTGALCISADGTDVNFSASIVDSYIPDENVTYYFPRYDLEINFAKSTLEKAYLINNVGDYEYAKEVIYWEIYSKVTGVYTVRVHPTYADIYDTSDLGYPQQINEYLYFMYHHDTIAIDLFGFYILPGSHTVEACGMFNNYNGNVSFVANGGDSGPSSESSYDQQGVYEYRRDEQMGGYIHFIYLSEV